MAVFDNGPEHLRHGPLHEDAILLTLLWQTDVNGRTLGSSDFYVEAIARQINLPGISRVQLDRRRFSKNLESERG